MKPTLSQSAPHIRRGRTTSAIMLDVLIALTLRRRGGVYVFGVRALLLLTVTMAASAAAQWLCLALRKGGGIRRECPGYRRPSRSSLPAGTFCGAAAAGVFAVAIVKEAFGGIGHNLFNPAMAARGLLLVAFPTLLTGYTRPDAVSSATPLSGIGSPGGPAEWLPMLTGTENGSMGETSALLLLVGGIYLVLRGRDPAADPHDLPRCLRRGDVGVRRRTRPLHRQRRRPAPLGRTDARGLLYGDRFHDQTDNLPRGSCCLRAGWGH